MRIKNWIGWGGDGEIFADIKKGLYANLHKPIHLLILLVGHDELFKKEVYSYD